MSDSVTAEEIKNAIKGKGLSMEEAAAKLEMSRQNLYYQLNRNPIGEDFLQLVKDKLDLHFDKEKSPNGLSFLEQRRAKKNQPRIYTAPFVPVKAQAGYVKAVDQEVYMDTLEQFALPPGVNPLGAIWRWWEVEGDSMAPEYNSGDHLLTSMVHQMDWENMRNFYAYVIVTKEAVLFKKIFCKNQHEWVLISVNEENYPQQLLLVEYIREVWVMRRHVRTTMPTTKMYEIKV